MAVRPLLLVAAHLLAVSIASAQVAPRKIGELELTLTGLTAVADPQSVTVPKNTASGIRVSLRSGGGADVAPADAARLLGGSFVVRGDLSGPGIRQPIALPQEVASSDPLLLVIPPLTQAGDYTLSNLRVTVNGSTAVDVAPRSVPVTVIDQVLITSVTTRPLTLDEIKQKGIVLDSNSYLGFEFTLGLAIDSKATEFTFPVVFDKRGVAVPQPSLPAGDPSRASMPPLTTIVPMLLKPADDGPEPVVHLPNGTDEEVRIPSVLVIPGNVGYLKQFFSAKLFVANGAPGISNLTVHDVIGKIKLPAGADQIPNNADDPLALPDTTKGPQSSSLPVRMVGLDGQPGTADDVGLLHPGEQGEAEFLLRGDKEGFHTIGFDIEATLDGLVTGPVKVIGAGTGGVLVRNPYFDMTFTAPAVVRQGERFTLFVTVNNISQSLANAVSVTLDASRMSGAHLVADATQTIDTLAARDSKVLQFQFQSDRSGQLVATYLNFDTVTGTTGNLKFTLAVGERGVVLSPDTLVLPTAVSFVPDTVLNAAMRVLGQAWSVANAPSGTLPKGVIRTTKDVVTQKALALAEAGLRISLGQPSNDAVRDLLFDFYGGAPVDPGFDQVLRATSAGTELARAIGATLQQASDASGGAAPYERGAAQIAASGADFVSFAIGNAAPLTLSITDGQNRRGASDAANATLVNGEIPSAVVVPLGTSSTASRLGVIAAPTSFPYTLDLTATASATIDFAVTLPNHGSFRRGTASGLAVVAGGKYRVIVDPAQALVLQIDANGDGTYETQQALVTETLFAQGPRLISANVIGPETLAGASPFGFQTALLFDRIVDANSAAVTSKYAIGKNKVLAARRQLSGRLVFAALEQPEGRFVPAQISVSGLADSRGVTGPAATVALGSRVTDVGAVVSGRVFNADGTPVRNAVITYAQNTELTCAPPLDEYAGLTEVRTGDDGRYELRFVRQDNCGMPFKLATADPNTGALRQLLSSVRVSGEQIVLDFAMFGRGSVTGIVRTLTGSIVPGADVVVISQTDTQVSGTAQTDTSGRYRIDGITVGPVNVRAVKGASLGRATGRIDRAGTAATVDLTLDGGTVRAAGIVKRVQGTSVTVVPALQVVFYVRGVAEEQFVPVAITQTASDGSYAFDGMPTGEYRITAALNSRDVGSVTGTAAAGDFIAKDIAIVVGGEGYGTIRGLVKFPDGAAAAGVIVSIDDHGVLTAADGSFELTNVIVKPAESQRVLAQSRDGLRQGTVSLLVSQPNQLISNVLITLSGIGSAEFTVLDANRNPVSDQEVGLLGECGNPCGCQAKRTGSDGKVRFDGLPLGQVRARAFRTLGNFIDQADAATSLTSDGGTAFGVLGFSGSGFVTGTVLNPDGSPALGADVRLVAKVFNEDFCSLVPGVAQRVRTDSAGKFRFTGVNLGEVSVTASHPFFTASVGGRGTLVRAGDTVDFPLKLVNTISGVLSGNVYLPDGVTSAGAGVEVTATGALPDVVVTTNEQGHFEFAKIFPEGSYTVTARDPLTGGVHREGIYLRAGQDVVHDFVLKGRGTVRVKVVNGAAQPVASAFIRLQETEFPSHTYEAAIEAANNGVATFEGVFEGPLTAEASDAFARGGRASSFLPHAGDTIDIQVALTTTGTVKGHFYKSDGTTPIPFGAIKLIVNGAIIGQTTAAGSDDVGAFSFSYVPAGPVRIEGQDPQTARTGIAVGAVTTEGEIVTLNVLAQGVGKVQGLVTSNGAPQPGAHVDVDSGSFHACTFADSTGRYLIDGVPEGRVTVTASLNGNFLTGTASGVLSGDGGTLTLDVALRDSGKLTGHVRNAGGATAAPLSLVTVQVSGAGGATLSTITDTAGAFAFDRVPAGLATINAAVLGGIDRAVLTTDIPGTVTTDITLTLNGVGSISGTTLDSGGQPIAGDVTVTGTGTFPYSFTVQSAANGAFALPQVLAGPFTASLRAKSGQFFLYGTATGTVAAGQTASVNIQVQPSGTVTGVVMRSNGTTPAIGANVTLSLDPNRGSVALQAGSDGRFTARGVPLGAFTARISDPITTGLAIATGNLANNGDTVDLGTLVLDDTPLAVVSASPANGAANVPVNQPIVLTFSNKLQSAFGIGVYDGAAQIGASASLSADQKTVTLTGTWPDSKPITVLVSTNVTDIFGRHPQTATSTTFTTVDLSPPHVVTIVPANDAIQVGASSTVTVTFSEPLAAATDLAALIAVAPAVTGTTALTSPAVAVFTPSAPLADNTVYNVTVNGATDAAGNKQTVAFTSKFASTDTVPPVVAITAPSAAWVKTARPQIVVTATDVTSGVNASGAALRIDGQIAASALTFTPATDLAQGSHTISATVPDRAGNIGAAPDRTFSVDTIAPSAATLTGIADDQVIKGTFTFTAAATDSGSGVASIELLSDGAAIATLPAPSFSAAYDTHALSEGVHLLSARATDVAGNVGAAGATVRVTIDNTPLVISFTSPTPNQPLRDSVTATVVPNRPVTRVDFTFGAQTASVTASPYTTTFSLAGLTEGSKSIGAAAFGVDGQTAGAAVTFLIDRTAPAPPDVSKITAEPVVASPTATVFGQAGAVEGSARIEIRNLNNGFVGTFTAGADGSFSASITASQGDSLALVAIDVAGNRSATSSITVQQNPSLPVVSWTCSSSGAMYPANYAAKLRVFALGNNQGISTNVVTKVEFFINNAPTAVLGTAVSGVANNYETTYTVTGAAGTVIPVRVVVTNTSGATTEATTSLAVVSGVEITANTTIDAANTTFDGQTLIIKSGTTTISGEHSFAKLIVLDGATLTHPRTDLATTYRLSVGNASRGDVFVSCLGSIDVTAKGYSNVNAVGQTDPGAGNGSSSASGGSHGGQGGGGAPGITYGSPYDPNEPGATGASGNNCDACAGGGGIVRIKANAFILDGKIWSNAQVPGAGQASGAGGSVRIDADTLSGGGEIRAEGNGRSSFEAAGGGGRIAVYYRALNFDRTKITAAGGAHDNAANVGGAGTVYYQQVDASGVKISDQLVIDNRGRTTQKAVGIPLVGIGSVASASGASVTTTTTFPDGVQGFSIEFLNPAGAVVSRYEIASRTSSNTIVLKLAAGETQANVPVPGTYRGVYRFDQLTAKASGTITMTGVIAATNVSLTSTTLTHPVTTASVMHRLNFDVDTLTVDSASAIDVTARGYADVVGSIGATFPGAAGSSSRGGGSHGGRGGIGGTAGSIYGSITDPDEPGGAGSSSGTNCGNCTSGGGIVRIKANTLVLNGRIWSNAGPCGAGFSSGAGGSIRLDVGSLSGSGEIKAEGNGRASFEAAGGGGRIAVYYQSMSFDQTKITAAGGAHNAIAQVGSAGTVYLQRVDATGAKLSEQLLLDNLGRANQTTNVFAFSITGSVVAVNGATVTISGTTIPVGVEKMLMELFNSAGTLVSSYRIASRASATSVVVELPAGQTQANASIPGTFRIVWRFDNLVIKNGGPMEVTGVLRAGSLAVSGGTTFTLPIFTGTTNRIQIEVDNDFTLDSTCSIDVTGKGWNDSLNGGSRTWNGYQGNRGGGSHGGEGGGTSGTPYGSAFDPDTMGSSGGSSSNCGNCGAGGGIVRLKAKNLVLDGKIFSNAFSGFGQASGAGGSVRIDAETFAGLGEIQALGNGRQDFEPAGGGGRIAVYYTTMTFDRAKLSAAGGAHNNPPNVGAPGTIFLKSTLQPYGELIIDNKGIVTQKKTTLTSVGPRTVTSFASDSVTDAAAHFFFPDHLRGVRLFLGSSTATNWPILSNTETTLRVDITNALLAPTTGQAFRGLYKLDALKLRNALVTTTDFVEVSTPVDKDAGSTLTTGGPPPP